jgi:hypothetical protein
MLFSRIVRVGAIVDALAVVERSFLLQAFNRAFFRGLQTSTFAPYGSIGG